MNHLSVIEPGTPVVVRSYVSGVIVGLLNCGANGTVGVTKWRWIRRWENVGGEGSVYDLIHSDKSPTRTGPFTEELSLLQQADVMVISEEAYRRLADPK